jgi:hypothetical protein
MINETGSCPAGSRIATAVSAAGPGTEPFVAEGPVYLTGKTPDPANKEQMDPFGLAIAVPAKTKAFNLGTVVVQAGISINKQTSAVTIDSEAPPLQKDGIPLRVKQISVRVDRPEFMFNPTNCEKKSISATITGESAGQATETPITETVEAPFYANKCSALPFAPKFTMITQGNASKRDGASLKVIVEQTHGEGNIGKVEVQLPRSLPSRLETLQKACRAVVFEHNPAECPPGATVGEATAHTPVLTAPLKGPAILVSHGGAKFPDLVFLLQGEGVEIELVGHTDIKNGITYSRFESVPDAPIKSFETYFPEKELSILGALGNLCEQQLTAPTHIVSQANKRFEQETHIQVTECGPSISVTSVKVSGKSLIVTLKSLRGGTITVSGKNLKTTKKAGVQSGTVQLRVPLSKAGLAAKRHKRKVSFTVTVTGSGKTQTKSAAVKL